MTARTPTIKSKQRGYGLIAVCVDASTCEELPDGSLVLHDCANGYRRIVVTPEDQAPWHPPSEDKPQ